jgi:hypothetical protein
VYVCVWGGGQVSKVWRADADVAGLVAATPAGTTTLPCLGFNVIHIIMYLIISRGMYAHGHHVAAGMHQP